MSTNIAIPTHDRITDNLLTCEIDFVDSDEFRAPDAPQIFSATPLPDASAGKLPPDLPAHLGRLCQTELLTADGERQLFARMNYLKFRAAERRAELRQSEATDEEIRASISADLREAGEIRDAVIRANMRLVIAVVKRFVTPQFSFDDLLSEGILSLVYAVDKFDYSKGFRFSTYAYRAIVRQVYRNIGNRQRQMQRTMGESVEVGLDTLEGADSSTGPERRQEVQSVLLQGMIDKLDRRERFIIRGRFALGGHRKTSTFQKLADKLGVSKERVRQLEQRALRKLQGMAQEEYGDVDFDLVGSLQT